MLAVDPIQVQLFPLIYEFNYLFCRHVHPSWYEQATPFFNEISLFQQYSNSQFSISNFLKKLFDLQDEIYINFDTQLSRFSLMENRELLYLVHYLGLVCVSPFIKKVIDGGTLRVLKDMLGEKDFEFAKKSAVFYQPHALFGLVGMKLDFADKTREEMTHRMMLCGIRCLALMYVDEPIALKKRMMLKLPKQYAEIFEVSAGKKNMEKRMVDSLSIYKVARKLIFDLGLTCRPIFV